MSGKSKRRTATRALALFLMLASAGSGSPFREGEDDPLPAARAAFESEEDSPRDPPERIEQLQSKHPRKLVTTSWERIRDRWAILIVPFRTAVPPGLSSRLDFCAEFTKPDSLKIRLSGTPKSHRSPPA